LLRLSVYSSFRAPGILLFLVHLATLSLGIYAFLAQKRPFPDWRLYPSGSSGSHRPLGGIEHHSSSDDHMRIQSLSSFRWSLHAITAALSIGRKSSDQILKAEKNGWCLGDFGHRSSCGMTYRGIASGWTLNHDVGGCDREKVPETQGYYNLGLAYGKQERLEASGQFQTTLSLDPNHIKARNSSGLAYQRQGLIDDAIKEWETALRHNQMTRRFTITSESLLRDRIDSMTR